jgi:hypothetical protein
MSIRVLEGPKNRIVFECDGCGVEYEMAASEVPSNDLCSGCMRERDHAMCAHERGTCLYVDPFVREDL